MKTIRFKSLLLTAFWPLTALVLWCDSRHVGGQMQHGQWLSDLMAPVFLLLLLGQLKPEQRLGAAIFVPLSAIGEIVFSLLFRLYDYRLGGVPLYVPFGHSILLSIGLLLADSDLVQRHQERFRVGLMAFHGALLTGMLFFFDDTLSALWGIGFFLLLRRTKEQVVYLIIGVLVLYIEILGTSWGCWRWGPSPFGVLHTVNPPVGAFACYVVGELCAMKCAALISTRVQQRHSQNPPVEGVSSPQKSPSEMLLTKLFNSLQPEKITRSTRDL